MANSYVLSLSINDTISFNSSLLSSNRIDPPSILIKPSSITTNPCSKNRLNLMVVFLPIIKVKLTIKNYK